MISKGCISLVVCLLHATLLNGQTPDKEVYRQNEVGWDWKTQAQEADLVIFLMGDTNIQDRENPVEAFTYLLPTLKQGWKLTYSREGLLVRVLVKNKKVEGVEFVPLVRDQDNWAVLIDPNEGLGAEVYKKVKEISEDTPLKLIGKTINIDGLE